MGSLSVSIVGNTALSSLRFLITAALAIVGSVVVARWLGPQEFGVYRLAVGVVWILEVLTVLAVPVATNKFVAELSVRVVGRGRALRSVVGFFAARATAIYVVAFVPFVVFRDAIARFYGEEGLVLLLLLGGLSVLPGAVAGIMSGALQGLQRFREVSAVALAHSIVTLGATVALLWAGFGVVGLFVVLLGGNLLQLGLMSAFLKKAVPRDGTVQPPDELRGRMGRFWLVTSVLAVLNAIVWERSEIFFLGRFSGAEEVAFYSLAYTVAIQARRLAPTALGEALFPVFARLDGMKDAWSLANAVAHATRYTAILGMPLAVGGVLFAAPLIRLAFGAAYLPAAPVLALLLVAAGAVSIAQPASAVLVATERYRFFLWCYGGLAVANIALDLALIPAHAATGAAIANTTVQVAGAVAQLAAAARLVAVPVPVGNLSRCLGAVLLALLAPAALNVWPQFGGGVNVVLMGLAFVAGYPIALAITGTLLPDDFRRLRALQERLPGGVRPAYQAVIRRVEACCP